MIYTCPYCRDIYDDDYKKPYTNCPHCNGELRPAEDLEKLERIKKQKTIFAIVSVISFGVFLFVVLQPKQQEDQTIKPMSANDSIVLANNELATKKYNDSLATAEAIAYVAHRRSPEGKKEYRDSINTAIVQKKRQAKLQKIMNKLSCSENDAELLLERKIWIGMTYSMVVYLRGRPETVNRSNYGYGEQYQACWEDYSPSCFYFDETQIITAYN